MQVNAETLNNVSLILSEKFGGGMPNISRVRIKDLRYSIYVHFINRNLNSVLFLEIAG